MIFSIWRLLFSIVIFLIGIYLLSFARPLRHILVLIAIILIGFTNVLFEEHSNNNILKEFSVNNNSIKIPTIKLPWLKYLLAKKVVYINIDKINVLNDYGSVITNLSKGAAVQVIESKGELYLIAFGTDKKGWVNKTGVSSVRPDTKNPKISVIEKYFVEDTLFVRGIVSDDIDVKELIIDGNEIQLNKIKADESNKDNSYAFEYCKTVDENQEKCLLKCVDVNDKKTIVDIFGLEDTD